MVDRNIKRGDLKDMAGISYATISKLEKGENVYVDILVKICRALGCTLDDIMEVLPEESNKVLAPERQYMVKR